MIYHNIYTITNRQYGLAQDFPEKVKRLPIWLPKKWNIKALHRLNTQFNEIMQSTETSGILDSKYYAIDLDARIDELIILYKVYKNAWLVEPPKYFKEKFKKLFRKEFEITDLELIANKIKILNDRLLTAIKDLKVDRSTKFDYTDFYIRIWKIIGINISNEKVYLMPRFVKQSNEILKNQTNG